ncbi:RNA polymerase-binding protein RbpA [Micromonospora peucetia]|uniref:RNA polymerase-binding protein RbpA n=1 Tax=Micromonospora peucetia TaxID=47871 RepID=A0A1C6VS41_9ACTN|nr:RNA polymerase-binding protein RbpA [Micromonospora peucetia]MCX4388384.1 RNA polymerase-binding protein RbpA [Micromonospora peucetia]WSA30950.1 RNA polymerase-binding protein RbpA [Micromonospora peucetia]SCL69007.1 RNA polymerase-binding protein [Micromonospora peucetia]
MPIGNVIRGTRAGSLPAHRAERHQPAPCRTVTYWCRNDHHTNIRLAAEVEVPEVWDCPRCGLPAGQDAQNPPGRARLEPYKTHLAYVKERRTAEEGEAILAEALAALRRRRGRAAT